MHLVISKWKHFYTRHVVPSPEVTDHFLSAFVCFFSGITLNQLENTLTVSTTLAAGYMSASSLLINRYEKGREQ